MGLIVAMAAGRASLQAVLDPYHHSTGILPAWNQNK
jgi:hypothetical protein